VQQPIACYPDGPGTLLSRHHRGSVRIIGVGPRALERTVSAYNEAVTGDASGFDPFRPDGLATSGDLVPPKSNWARPIDEPPYLAYPIACSVVLMFGGIATNERAEVLLAPTVTLFPVFMLRGRRQVSTMANTQGPLELVVSECGVTAPHLGHGG
jgi:hypothetical protein